MSGLTKSERSESPTPANKRLLIPFESCMPLNATEAKYRERVLVI